MQSGQKTPESRTELVQFRLLSRRPWRSPLPRPGRGVPFHPRGARLDRNAASARATPAASCAAHAPRRARRRRPARQPSVVSSSPVAAPRSARPTPPHPSSSESTAPPSPPATPPAFCLRHLADALPAALFFASCSPRPVTAHHSHEDLHQDRRQWGDQPLLGQARRQEP